MDERMWQMEYGPNAARKSGNGKIQLALCALPHICDGVGLTAAGISAPAKWTRVNASAGALVEFPSRIELLGAPQRVKSKHGSTCRFYKSLHPSHMMNVALYPKYRAPIDGSSNYTGRHQDAFGRRQCFGNRSQSCCSGC